MARDKAKEMLPHPRCACPTKRVNRDSVGTRIPHTHPGASLLMTLNLFCHKNRFLDLLNNRIQPSIPMQVD